MTTTTTSPKAFCPGCGTRNEGASRFCAACGTPLADAVATPMPKVAPEADRVAAGQPAWWRRLLAYLIDGVLTFVATALVVAVLYGIADLVFGIRGAYSFGGALGTWAGADMFEVGGVFSLAMLLGIVLYYGFQMGGPKRSTVGQRALGYRIHDAESSAPLDQAGAIRYSLAIAMYDLPIVWPFLLVATFVCFFARSDNRMLHDLVAGTTPRLSSSATDTGRR